MSGIRSARTRPSYSGCPQGCQVRADPESLPWSWRISTPFMMRPCCACCGRFHLCCLGPSQNCYERLGIRIAVNETSLSTRGPHRLCSCLIDGNLSCRMVHLASTTWARTLMPPPASRTRLGMVVGRPCRSLLQTVSCLTGCPFVRNIVNLIAHNPYFLQRGIWARPG